MSYIFPEHFDTLPEDYDGLDEFDLYLAGMSIAERDMYLDEQATLEEEERQFQSTSIPVPSDFQW